MSSLISQPKRFSTVAIAIVVIVTVLTLYLYADFFDEIASTEVDGISGIPIATESWSSESAAFVFLSLGSQANQMNCPAAIESLVKHGGTYSV